MTEFCHGLLLFPFIFSLFYFFPFLFFPHIFFLFSKCQSPSLFWVIPSFSSSFQDFYIIRWDEHNFTLYLKCVITYLECITAWFYYLDSTSEIYMTCDVAELINYWLVKYCRELFCKQMNFNIATMLACRLLPGFICKLFWIQL